jgi:hypothetical protein
MQKSANNTLKVLRDDVLRRLGDTETKVWTESEIDGYLREGYNRTAERVECFWDIAYLENLPYSGDHTSEWEEDYYDGTDIFQDKFQFTAKWEVDYIDNAYGPANHISPWEWKNSYVANEYLPPVSTLPDVVYKINRATNDWIEVDPIPSYRLESQDSQYETLNGRIVSYLMDKDGLRTLRKYKAPCSKAEYFETTGDFGVLRDPSDISGETVTGSWGIPRRIPGEHPMGKTWGFPRRVYKDSGNFRIEFYRRGYAVESDSDEFEFSNSHCKYIRHYAMWKALIREGAGQDLKLAKHYEERWLIGINRIGDRKIKTVSNRTGVFGGETKRHGPPPKPVLPWSYGRMER